jgi:hypothetical protein
MVRRVASCLNAQGICDAANLHPGKRKCPMLITKEVGHTTITSVDFPFRRICALVSGAYYFACPMFISPLLIQTCIDHNHAPTIRTGRGTWNSKAAIDCRVRSIAIDDPANDITIHCKPCICDDAGMSDKRHGY